MGVVAIVQARTGSTRLPGKVLKEIGGATMLARVVRRVRRAETIDRLVVATTTMGEDDAVAEECKRLDVECFRGSTADVLDRYYRAARHYEAGTIVRITADCPLVDREVSDLVATAFLRERPHYASNTLERTYPTGLDVEVVSPEALACAWREAGEGYQRSHVMPFLYEHPERFSLLSVKSTEDFSRLRWTVDRTEDLDLVRRIYARLGDDDRFSWREALRVVIGDPGLEALNRNVPVKPLREG